MQPKASHTRGGGYKNVNPWIHVAKFLFRTSPASSLTLGPKKTLSYRGDSTVGAAPDATLGAATLQNRDATIGAGWSGGVVVRGGTWLS